MFINGDLMKVIGIAGKMASGKTTSAEILEKIFIKKGKNTFRTSLSEILKDILYDEVDYADVKMDWPNKEWERNNLIEFGKELKKKYHDAILVELAFKKAEHHNADVLIIDGVRTVSEALYIKNNNGLLLYIDANDVIRYQRLKLRNSIKDKEIRSIDDFFKVDLEEDNLYRVRFLQGIANVIVINNKSELCLFSILTEAIKLLQEGGVEKVKNDGDFLIINCD